MLKAARAVCGHQCGRADRCRGRGASAGRGRLAGESGSSLDLGALLVFSALIGFTGSLISLAISKWSAKVTTGAKIIDQPRTATESWLLSTVAAQADAAGIGHAGCRDI